MYRFLVSAEHTSYFRTGGATLATPAMAGQIFFFFFFCMKDFNVTKGHTRIDKVAMMLIGVSNQKKKKYVQRRNSKQEDKKKKRKQKNREY